MAKTYKVHMWVHLAYDTEIEADSIEEARGRAEMIWENLELDDMEFGDGEAEIIEEV